MDISKEIERCFQATVDSEEKSTYNKEYYRGLHDAYIHLMRSLGHNI